MCVVPTDLSTLILLYCCFSTLSHACKQNFEISEYPLRKFTTSDWYPPRQHQMTSISIESIENIVDNYQREIEQLSLPTLRTLHQQCTTRSNTKSVNTTTTTTSSPPSSPTTSPTTTSLTTAVVQNETVPSSQYLQTSPYVAKYKLDLIQCSLINLLSTLDNNNYSKTHKQQTKNSSNSYTRTKNKLEHLLSNEIDEKLYITNELIKIYNQQNTPPAPHFSDEYSMSPSSKTLHQKHLSTSSHRSSIIPEGDNLNELRHRLLSSSSFSNNSKGQSETLAGEDASKLNTYHESIQEDILNELSQLTSSLKTSAMTLSSKILGDDLNILNETNENMVRNSNLFKVIDRNLNDYLENKTGNRISLMFLIKCVVGVVIAFIVMMFFIAIVPRIR